MARGGNKYFAKKTECAFGHKHDSKSEASRCNELHEEQDLGLISQLEVHPKYFFAIHGKQVKHDNGRRVGMVPDWAYLDNRNGKTVVEDRKGMVVRDYAIRKAIFRALYPEIEFRETRG
jgi:hypothetical protein